MKTSKSKTPSSHPYPSRNYYTLAEMQAIRRTAAAGSPEDELRVLFQAMAGFRSAELEQINLRMIDLAADRIVLMPSETYKAELLRTIPLQPPLRRHVEIMMADGIFTYGSELCCHNWPHRQAQMLSSAGVEPVHNGLRHGYAVHRLAQGINPRQIADELDSSGYEAFVRSHLVQVPVSEWDGHAWFSE